MEATTKRQIKTGQQYDRFFPKIEGNTTTIRKNANVGHTVAFIPKVVNETLRQTKKIAQHLKARSLEDTCSNIWHFVYEHINYKKDEEGKEQVRNPARAWHDRKTGVDCDCYTVFISSILKNLDIPHILRITKYRRDYFQHIYPVVPLTDGSYITIDCVTDQYNYEVPYTEKKDYPMDLQYLNGFDGDGMGELGKLIQKKMAAQKSKPFPVKTKVAILLKRPAQLPAKPAPAAQASMPAVKKKKGIKKVLNKINKLNPATLLLRNGVLASMKLNIKNVAKRLRWSYLNPAEAEKRGIDPARFKKLVTTRQKLETIFYGAGGNPNNLKKAILSGKGNKDKAVSGLGMIDMMAGVDYMNEHTPLTQLLGGEIYYSENIEGFAGIDGLGQLGEPVTLASVGAATGVIAAIVAALKQVGDIFKKKEKGSVDFDAGDTDPSDNNKASTVVAIPSTATNPVLPASTAHNPDDSYAQEATPNYTTSRQPSSQVVRASPVNTNMSYDEGSPGQLIKSGAANNEVSFDETASQTLPTPTASTSNSTGTKQGFWDKNKKWLKPVAIGVGGIGIIALGFKLMNKNKHSNKSSTKSLSGFPRKKKKKRKHYLKSKKQRKKYHKKKTAIALL